MAKEQELTELIRAEDLFLGALGLAEDACLEKLLKQDDKYFVVGKFNSDNQSFKMEFDLEIGDLEKWALEVLRKNDKVVIG